MTRSSDFHVHALKINTTIICPLVAIIVLKLIWHKMPLPFQIGTILWLAPSVLWGLIWCPIKKEENEFYILTVLGWRLLNSRNALLVKVFKRSAIIKITKDFIFPYRYVSFFAHGENGMPGFIHELGSVSHKE